MWVMRRAVYTLLWCHTVHATIARDPLIAVHVSNDRDGCARFDDITKLKILYPHARESVLECCG